MATTLKEAFNQFKTALEITDRQEQLVADSRANMVRNLKKELYLADEESRVIGSWGRNTLTRYMKEADVDVLVILDYEQHKDWYTPYGAISCLDKFKRIIDDKYPNTTNRRDQNCITVKFTAFRLDVVPAFFCNDGSFKIPDTIKGNWISTNPVSFANLITQVNKSMNGTFVPLIKMVKGWNREVAWPIKSFHLECLLYKHYKTYTQDFTYDSTLSVFFKALPDYLRDPCFDPVTGERVDSYLDNNSYPSKRQQAVTKATAAAKDAGQAYSYHPSNSEISIKLWGTLMGRFFPAYG